MVEVGDGTVAKATIPSPTMILRQEILSNDGTSRIQTIYPEIGDFYKDLAQTYKDAIAAFTREVAVICNLMIQIGRF